MNEAGFWDVARARRSGRWSSATPARTRSAPCSRNLTDSQLDAVGASGGLVGIVFACCFLRADFANDPDTRRSSLIVEHARYVADRIGVEHVAFGSDFDGATIPGGARRTSPAYPRLLAALAAPGFGPRDQAIAWDNWRRVLDAWWR